jgi:secretion/DNA translocation related CpaE-like protein
MAQVIGVVGARGGAGASVLAASLAAAFAAIPDRDAADRHRTAVADLTVGGGLDIVLGIEEMPGLRWPDLNLARGAVDGRELVALLPEWQGVTVLSADRLRPFPPQPEVVGSVVDALAEVHAVVLLDLDRADVLDAVPRSVLGRCRTVLVVTPLDLRGAAGAVSMKSALVEQVPDVRLVVRGPSPGGLAAIELAHVLDLPIAGMLPYRRRLDVALDAGAGPPRRGAYARAVGRLARDLR